MTNVTLFFSIRNCVVWPVLPDERRAGSRMKTDSSTFWRTFLFVPERTLGFCFTQKYKAAAATRTFP